MLSARLIELIENHAEDLAHHVVEDIRTNPHTRSFARIPREEVEERYYGLFRDLGRWLTDTREEVFQAEYGEFGRKRRKQGIPLSEIMYALIIVKSHLVRYVLAHAETDGRVSASEMLPVHLYNELQLFTKVSQFFDRAFYHLARGYEEAGIGAR